MTNVQRQKKEIRRLEEGAVFETLWDSFDTGDSGAKYLLSRLAAVFFEHAKPDQEDRILLPKPEAELLCHQLETLGVGAGQLLITPGHEKTYEFRILRNLPTKGMKQGLGPAERYLGMQLKRVLAVIRMAECVSRP